MKKTLVFILALSVLTACNAEEKTSETAKVNETTEAATEMVTVDAIDTEEISGGTHCIDCKYYNHIVSRDFITIDSFSSYLGSEQMNEEFATWSHYNEPLPSGYDGLTPCIPKYDENKYRLNFIRLDQSEYSYIFDNLATDDILVVTVIFKTNFHTFEEMDKALDDYYLSEPRNLETTNWGDTPALIKVVQNYPKKIYSIASMIDENNCVHICEGGFTPEELTEILNDFTFE